MASASPAKMKVADLKISLGSRGMSTAGLKAELVSRLEKRIAEERHPPKGSFGLESSTPPRSIPGNNAQGDTPSAPFGSPHRHHADAHITLSPHRHHETRRGLWGVPLSEKESNDGAHARDRVLVLSSALREEQLVVARERDARARDREHRAEAEENLRHARARLDKHDAEVHSLRQALEHAKKENERVTSELNKVYGENSTEKEKKREMLEEMQVLKDRFDERDEQLKETTEMLQGQIADAAEAKANSSFLKEQLAETKQLLSVAEGKAEAAFEEQRNTVDKYKAIQIHDPNPGIIVELEKKLDEQMAVNSALDAAASGAIEESNEFQKKLYSANDEISQLQKTIQMLEGSVAESETRCLLHATDLEQTRWREAAAGTRAAHLEERVLKLESEREDLERRVESNSKATSHSVHRAETAEAEVARADLRARAAVEEKDTVADEAMVARATAAAAALELRAVTADAAAAKASLTAALKRAEDAESNRNLTEERFDVLRRESSSAAARARDVSSALRDTREKLTALTEKHKASEQIAEAKDLRIKAAEKRMKTAERKLKALEAQTVSELESRDKENLNKLQETSKTLASRAELLIAEAKKKADACRQSLESAKVTYESEMKSIKMRHASVLEQKDAQLANIVTACKQEEAATEEAVARCLKSEARVRACEASLERQRDDLRDAEEARRDAEAAAEKFERKAKSYREEHETLIYKYEHLMRKLGRVVEETHHGTQMRQSRTKSHSRARSQVSGSVVSEAGDGGEGESRREFNEGES